MVGQLGKKFPQDHIPEVLEMMQPEIHAASGFSEAVL